MPFSFILRKIGVDLILRNMAFYLKMLVLLDHRLKTETVHEQYRKCSVLQKISL